MKNHTRYLMPYVLLMLFLQFSFGHAGESNYPDPSTRKNKILVLILASDDQPVYTKLQQVWRSYMHLDPEHIEAYFMKSNPDLEVDCEIVDDTIWVKAKENVIPGLLYKTIKSMELLQPRLEEFDYVLRTNISSFYVFPRLLTFAQTLPKEKCYCGYVGCCSICFASGAGFMLSPDLVNILLERRDQIDFNTIDDVSLGCFFDKLHIPITSASRCDFLSLQSWLNGKDRIPLTSFHFRTKHVNPRLRETEEVYVQTALLEMFYHINLSL